MKNKKIKNKVISLVVLIGVVVGNVSLCKAESIDPPIINSPTRTLQMEKLELRK